MRSSWSVRIARTRSRSGTGRGDIDQISLIVKTDPRSARKAAAGDAVIFRQHGGRQAAILVEVQRDVQILAAGAGNAVDVAICGEVQGADAPVGVKPDRRAAEAGQAVDLLIAAECHVVKAAVLLRPVKAKERVCAKPSRAELPLSRQRCADQATVASEPGFAAAAGNAGHLDILPEGDEPRPAVRP